MVPWCRLAQNPGSEARPGWLRRAPVPPPSQRRQAVQKNRAFEHLLFAQNHNDMMAARLSTILFAVAVAAAVAAAAAATPPLSAPAASYADTQTAPTEKGTLEIRLEYDEIKPDEKSNIRVDFLNPVTGNIQQHIDYTIAVTKDGQNVFGPIPLTHTSPGSVTIPVSFAQGDGIYEMGFTVEGILFSPIPPEKASFDIIVGGEPATGTAEDDDNGTATVAPVIPSWIKNTAGWWAEGQIDDAAFVRGLEYLIQNGVVVVPDAAPPPAEGEGGAPGLAAPQQIPPWIRNTAGWWAEGQIDDAAFVNALQYLIGQGVIQVP